MDGSYPVTDEATPGNKSYRRLPMKGIGDAQGKLGNKGFQSLASPKTRPSNGNTSRHCTSKLPYNSVDQPESFWSNTQSEQIFTHYRGSLGHKTCNRVYGTLGNPEFVNREKSSQSENFHDTLMNKVGNSVLPLRTDGLNVISGTKTLNQGLQGLPYEPNPKASHWEDKKTIQIKRLSRRFSTQDEQGKRPPLEPWQVQKSALLEKFGSSGWCPRKRLSPDALEGIRALHSQFPEKYTTPVLANQFQVSPEAIRRILKSKWRANEVEEEQRRLRWDRRGKAIWSQMIEIGIKPPKKWRAMGVKKVKNDDMRL